VLQQQVDIHCETCSRPQLFFVCSACTCIMQGLHAVLCVRIIHAAELSMI
jgi:hypothetical protein